MPWSDEGPRKLSTGLSVVHSRCAAACISYETGSRYRESDRRAGRCSGGEGLASPSRSERRTEERKLQSQGGIGTRAKVETGGGVTESSRLGESCRECAAARYPPADVVLTRLFGLPRTGDRLRRVLWSGSGGESAMGLAAGRSDRPCRRGRGRGGPDPPDRPPSRYAASGLSEDAVHFGAAHRTRALGHAAPGVAGDDLALEIALLLALHAVAVVGLGHVAS